MLATKGGRIEELERKEIDLGMTTAELKAKLIQAEKAIKSLKESIEEKDLIITNQENEIK